MKRLIFISILCSFFTTAFAEKINLEVSGHQGDHIFMLIPKSHIKNKDYIQKVAEGMCLKKVSCYVSFWQKGQASPTKFPLTDEQVESQIASYKQNDRTGRKEMIWKCSRFPGTPTSACFS